MLMAASLPLPSHSHASLSLNPLPSRFHRYHYFFLNPHPYKPHKCISTTLTLRRSTHNLTTASAESFFRAQEAESPNPKLLLRLAASSVLLFLGCFGFGAVRPLRLPPALAAAPLQEEAQDQSELRAAFDAWKSKTYALTVPLKIVALRGSVPPSWIKDFIQSQGKRLKFSLKYNASLEGIFSDLSMPSRKGRVSPSSTMAADIVSVGDSWLNLAISKSIIEPIQGADDQEWFKALSDKWKDWSDLWRPELEGKISMVDSPREVVGAVLKYMGASYNTNNLDLQVDGGRTAVQKNLELLGKQSSLVLQVRLFDSVNYLKAFGVGDVWVAVGWSTDIIPFAKRSSNVAVIVPKSGASLWADLWAIPAATRFETNRIGGRVRGPSPLIHQWIEFCLQDARAMPFKQEVIPGASPSALEGTQVEVSTELTKGKPKLDSNLIAGAPPHEILARSEFLEPLSDSTWSDYQWLVSTMQKPGHGLIHRMHHCVSFMIQSFWLKTKPHSKVT
ncbi:uncharacterized protein LOC132176077 isoform X3 [Corylus avellana]|uniref:uncharacterized protein LOC132176077 isoform X3 n=1 Tax=Corylus avellana TaxID=13451 RepID=UPI00286D5E9D|nr:uncharacterized protein LOC132176077 isoform X3 [Corylus avellana]